VRRPIIIRVQYRVLLFIHLVYLFYLFYLFIYLSIYSFIYLFINLVIIASSNSLLYIPCINSSMYTRIYYLTIYYDAFIDHALLIAKFVHPFLS
jgi:hypothetical protein